VKFWAIISVLIIACQSYAADKTVNIGAGFDYIPIAILRYDNSSVADFEIVDNIAWQGRLSYSFGNGFKSGLMFDYLSKSIRPGSSIKTDLRLWGLGAFGDYGYEITETGHTLLVAGMETGYGELSDKSIGVTKSSGAPWVAGLIGTRFLIGGAVWLETVYRLGWQEFEIAKRPSRKYRFGGSSLRISLDIPIYPISKKTEEK
jgi:hypothetical protein